MTDYVMTSTHVGGNVRNPALREFIGQLDDTLKDTSIQVTATAGVATLANGAFITYGPTERSQVMDMALDVLNLYGSGPDSLNHALK